VIAGTIARTARQFPHFNLVRLHASAAPTGTRSSWSRMTKLCALAARNELGNQPTLSARFGVSGKTIQRDIRHLVTAMNLPVRFDTDENRYVTIKLASDLESADQRCREFAFRFSAPKRKGGKA